MLNYSLLAIFLWRIFMPSKPEEAKEYARYIEFTESNEYKKLTQGENAVFKDFNPQSAQDLQNLRDYIYSDLPSISRTIEFANMSSLSISRMQIGMALVARDEYQQKLEKEIPKSHKRIITPTATTSKNGYVGRIKGYDASRRFRC
ncbi:MAG: hypothetical protein IJW72_01630 [Alphaproteobacteria bacterium]|nr:hypothetical protein [Alphaproteobacteria bacterium]